MSTNANTARHNVRWLEGNATRRGTSRGSYRGVLLEVFVSPANGSHVTFLGRTLRCAGAFSLRKALPSVQQLLREAKATIDSWLDNPR